jgi:uncharacterized YceG family protein
MSKQRVNKSPYKSKNSHKEHSSVRSTIRSRKERLTPVPSYLKILSVFMFLGVSLLMTGTTTFLYKLGLDPVEFYSNMANPYMKLVNIPAGLRREETALRFAKVLSWDQKNIDAFLNTAPKDERGSLDGYYLPGPYWVKTTATGADVANQMLRNFNSKVSEQILSANSKSKSKTNKSAMTFTQKMNLDTAVRVASIIQREAAGDVDMRIISGVIWNRIFKGMSLDMDATLQYAKASEQDLKDGLVASASSTIVWWPKVVGKDKYIDSPFNTYKNKGLPPTAIANPSLKAIAAAFNPAKTDCLFYIHDNNRGFHCEKTYEAHKENVQKYLVGKN